MRKSSLGLCVVVAFTFALEAHAMGKAKSDPAAQPAPQPTSVPTSKPMPLPTSTGSAGMRELPNRIFGVTVDRTSNQAATIDALKSLPRRPTVRVVFDEQSSVKPADYRPMIDAIRPHGWVMGELLDSYYLKNISLADYKARAKEWMSALGGVVDLWEIGNEVNGDGSNTWTGPGEDIGPKILAGYQVAKEKRLKTALTLYYSGESDDENCWTDRKAEMFSWAEKYVAPEMKQGLDYVFISFYDGDNGANGNAGCPGVYPDWNDVFARLARMFPNSKVGFGEVGAQKSELVESFINRYYPMKISEPAYVGGHFWWYFQDQMVPKTQPAWSQLANAWGRIAPDPAYASN